MNSHGLPCSTHTVLHQIALLRTAARALGLIMHDPSPANLRFVEMFGVWGIQPRTEYNRSIFPANSRHSNPLRTFLTKSYFRP